MVGGQRQRMAPALEPPVRLLDEPFPAVAAPTRQTLYRELAALRQSVALSRVRATHDLHEARRLAARAVIIDALKSSCRN